MEIINLTAFLVAADDVIDPPAALDNAIRSYPQRLGLDVADVDLHCHIIAAHILVAGYRAVLLDSAEMYSEDMRGACHRLGLRVYDLMATGIVGPRPHRLHS